MGSYSAAIQWVARQECTKVEMRRYRSLIRASFGADPDTVRRDIESVRRGALLIDSRAKSNDAYQEGFEAGYDECLSVSIVKSRGMPKENTGP